MYFHFNEKNRDCKTESACDCIRRCDSNCHANNVATECGRLSEDWMCEFALPWFLMRNHPMIIEVPMYTVPLVRFKWPAEASNPETLSVACYFSTINSSAVKILFLFENSQSTQTEVYWTLYWGTRTLPEKCSHCCVAISLLFSTILCSQLCSLSPQSSISMRYSTDLTLRLNTFNIMVHFLLFRFLALLLALFAFFRFSLGFRLWFMWLQCLWKGLYHHNG